MRPILFAMLGILGAAGLLGLAACDEGGGCTYDTDCPGAKMCVGGECVAVGRDGGEDGSADGGGPDGDAGADGGDFASVVPVNLETWTFETGPTVLTSQSYRLVTDGFLSMESTHVVHGDTYVLEGAFVW